MLPHEDIRPEEGGEPPVAWINELQSSFAGEYRDAEVTESAYREAILTEGEVLRRLKLDGSDNVFVFGTYATPRARYVPIFWAANAWASEASGWELRPAGPADTLTRTGPVLHSELH